MLFIGGKTVSMMNWMGLLVTYFNKTEYLMSEQFYISIFFNDVLLLGQCQLCYFIIKLNCH